MMTEEQKAAEVFRHRVPIQIRFNDVDGYGHVNNNAYFAYYDLGKESYLAEVLQKDFRTGKVVPVVANINANFLFPIFYGDNIVVETRVAHLGAHPRGIPPVHRSLRERRSTIVRATHYYIYGTNHSLLQRPE